MELMNRTIQETKTENLSRTQALSSDRDPEEIAKEIFPHLTERELSVTIEKLRYTGKTTTLLEEGFEKSLSKIPARHRMLAKAQIKGIVITDDENKSFYDPRTKMIHMSKFADPDDVIHEYAHALGEALGSYSDPAFKQIMQTGLEHVTVVDVMYDEDTFSEPIYYVKCDKFVSQYQGRLYEEVGIYSGNQVSLDGMLEYLTVGYEEYIKNPENLRKLDPNLFYYLEGIE